MWAPALQAIDQRYVAAIPNRHKIMNDLLRKLDTEAFGDTMRRLLGNTVSIVTDSSMLGGTKSVIGFNLVPGCRDVGGVHPQDTLLWSLDFPGEKRQVNCSK